MKLDLRFASEKLDNLFSVSNVLSFIAEFSEIFLEIVDRNGAFRPSKLIWLRLTFLTAAVVKRSVQNCDEMILSFLPRLFSWCALPRRLPNSSIFQLKTTF